MENIFVEFLPPWVETGLQPAFYDKESGTVLQQTARMYARVNMLIRMFNKLSKNTKETVEDYINKFNELHEYVEDYFENLDVQEKINNKLDQMYEDGQLADIIAGYIQLKGILAYDNVASLKTATNLVNGSFAETYGYISCGDGGSAKYKIRTVTNQDVVDECTIISLADVNLVAELVIDDNEINVKQFGVKGDGTTNDTANLQKAINYCATNDINCYVPSGTYMVSKLSITSPIEMYGDGIYTVLKSIANNNETEIMLVKNAGVNNSRLHDFKIDGNRGEVSNSVIGLKLYIDDVSYAGDLYPNLYNIRISSISGKGLVLDTTAGAIKEARIDNVTVIGGNNDGIYLHNVSDSLVNRCTVAGVKNYGFYYSKGGSTKITNCKSFWCGIGDGTTVEDGNRLPVDAFAVTADATPQSGKYYYTRSGSGVTNDAYIFTEFTGSSFDGGTTYYELTTFYSKRYAGFYIDGSSILCTSCESQDNYGDGFVVTGGDNKFSNVGCDNNGMITDGNGDPVSYASVSKTQLYYGIVLSGWQFYAEGCYFTNHQSSSIGKSQKGSAYITGGGNITINGTEANQVVNGITIQGVAYPLTISSTINNKEWYYSLPVNTYATPKTGFEYTDKNYLFVKNNVVYYRFCIKRSNGNGILNGDTLVNIINLNSSLRPTVKHNVTAYMTDNGGYLIKGIATGFIESWGDIGVRYFDTSLNNIKQVIIEGSYSL